MKLHSASFIVVKILKFLLIIAQFVGEIKKIFLRPFSCRANTESLIQWNRVKIAIYFHLNRHFKNSFFKNHLSVKVSEYFQLLG